MGRITRRVLATVSVFALIGIVGSLPAQAATPAFPTSITSVGDSITRAYDVNGTCFLKDCPTYSWSTGTVTTVNSELLRLQKASGKTLLANNYAKTGAKMGDLNGQLVTSAASKPGYLTILIGANDACTSTIAGMTPTATFQSQFQTALTGLFSASPNTLVSVSSIPNVYNLWSVLQSNKSAKSTWSLFSICQSMLKSTNTDAQRQQVLAQVVAYNTALATVCAQFTNCKYDGGAVFNTAFVASDISTVDYFHPSVAGQTKLALNAWNASYWPTY